MVGSKHLTLLVVVFLAGPGISRAQHIDVLIEQANGKLVTGSANFDTQEWTIGARVYNRDFDGDFSINNPGFNSLASNTSGFPADAQPLPGNTELSWDFLPMTIDGISQNLFYWNGQESDGVPGFQPSDVHFGALPGLGYTLSLYGKPPGAPPDPKFSVTGADLVVPGGVIEETSSQGGFHRHRFFQLEDGDGNGGTMPADGLYLLAMQMRMPGLVNSLPLFIVFGTPGSSVSAEDDAAVPWVNQQLNIPGDYNKNGVVDAADYVLWRRSNGQIGAGLAADGDGNHQVDQGDYAFWRQRFGNASQLVVNSFPSSGKASALNPLQIPEPAMTQAVLSALVGFILFYRFPRL